MCQIFFNLAGLRELLAIPSSLCSTYCITLQVSELLVFVIDHSSVATHFQQQTLCICALHANVLSPFAKQSRTKSWSGLPDYTESDWDDDEAFRNLTPEGLLLVPTCTLVILFNLTLDSQSLRSGPTLQIK